MTMMKVGDVACIEIFGTKFFIKHEGGGFGIFRDDPKDPMKCLAYMDGFYVDPENAGEPGEEYYAFDPEGSLEGLFQLLVYDMNYGEPSAKTVWRGKHVTTSVADGEASQVKFARNGRMYYETIITDKFRED